MNGGINTTREKRKGIGISVSQFTRKVDAFSSFGKLVYVYHHNHNINRRNKYMEYSLTS